MISRDVLFGTDGIRGIYGKDLTLDIAYKLGNALGNRAKYIVVGRDTRPSGIELYKSLRKGILDAGADIYNLGIVPTPVVSYVTSHKKADFGVCITASHNSKEYNGLKVFATCGNKLDDATIKEVESDMKCKLSIAKNRGEEIEEEGLVDEYKKMLFDTFSEISGLNIGLDLTNGALSTIGKEVFSSIFKDVVIINGEGNGAIINERSGALYPSTIAKVVVDNCLDVGFSFDGDGDRIMAVDNEGNIVNGDMMLYIISKYLKELHSLNNNIVIGTHYTNMGVEKALTRSGITLLRSKVGDSNVAVMMNEHHASIGAERAGHVILSQYSKTGDGLLVALYLCKIMCDTGQSLAKLCSVDEYAEDNFDIITDRAGEIVTDDRVVKHVSEIESKLKDSGRVLMRASGTEAKLRIMVECIDEDMVSIVGNDIRGYITNLYGIN